MNSQIILVKNIKMDRNYNNVLSFSEDSMVSLCRNNQVAISSDYSFIRKNTNRISTHFTYSQCIQSNYIAFQNYDYSNKWFFAWIDEVIYKNDGTTELVYTVDEWSTWFDYWQKKNCLISRQHVNDDTVGLHTVPENLDVGTLIADSSTQLFPIGSYYWIVIVCNYDPVSNVKDIGIGAYAGYVQGSRWYAWLINTEDFSNTINTELNKVNAFIKMVTDDRIY